MKRRRIRLWVLCIVWLSLIATVWQSGIVAGWIHAYLLPGMLPKTLDGGFEISRITTDGSPVVPDRGLRISVAPRRLLQMLKAYSPFFQLLPPGLIRDGVVLHGCWIPEKAPPEQSLPISISCTDEAGDDPWVVFRFPVKDLNALLRSELAEEWRDEDEYIFGTYVLNQRIWFETLTIQSEDALRIGPDSPVRFLVSAGGKLRYNFEDGVIDATITAKVKHLDGVLEFTPVRHEDGVGFDYICKVDRLDVAVDNMAPWLERKLAGELRQSIEKSMNKRRKRRKVAAVRLPNWVPLNVVVDVIVEE